MATIQDYTAKKTGSRSGKTSIPPAAKSLTKAADPLTYGVGLIQNLGQLTDAKLTGPLHALVVMFASGSPRDVVQVCQEILSEQLRIGPSAAKIDLDAILEGITKFSIKRSQELPGPTRYSRTRKGQET